MKINNKNSVMYKNSVNTVQIIFCTLTLITELMVEENCRSQQQYNLMIVGSGSYKECYLSLSFANYSTCYYETLPLGNIKSSFM